MSKLKSLGIHVFAGGFTRGVIDAGWQVDYQLEKHGFGLETAEAMCGVKCINEEHWPIFPDGEHQMAHANPRCTAFSTITSGARYVNNNTHGAFAHQTCDIQELCKYAAGKFDFVIWESVQQAYKASGRALVDTMIREHFVNKHYRIAHVFINAATFNNAQQRKRYFFVAYRDNYRFNIEPPKIIPYYSVLWDIIKDTRNDMGHESHLFEDDYDERSYINLSEDEWAALKKMPNGWGLHQMAQYAYEDLPLKFKSCWDTRLSDLPFSLHSIFRLNWLRPCPTLHSSACRLIHPWLHRPLTIGELSKIMGWPRIPVGYRPVAQIAKGIVPAVGQWLARQVQLSIEGHWGRDDWESSYDDNDHEWKGHPTHGCLEKTIDMTRYVGKLFDKERYDDDALRRHQHDVELLTKRIAERRAADKLAQR